MKLSHSLIILLFCFGCASSSEKAAKQTDDGPPKSQWIEHAPPFSDIVEIMVDSPKSPRWYVIICKDGNGQLVGGALGSDGAVFPRGTFNFRKVYDSFRHPVGSALTGGDRCMVSFSTVNDRGYIHGFYTWDAETVRAVFDTAKQHCVPREVERFNKIWSERPPFQK